MRRLPIMRKVVGTTSRYKNGIVKYIDFTYSDCIIVWVQYKYYSKAYRWAG